METTVLVEKNLPPVSSRTTIAISYAARGWMVFPIHWIDAAGNCSCGRSKCSSAGKHPRTNNGCKDATTDERQIFEWFTRWPLANIAIATGKDSGLIVLDVDPRHEGDHSLGKLESQYGKLPETITALTGGGGQHYFFKHPGIEVKNKAGIRPGLDIRGDGGYVVAPPSNHVSGGEYSWDVSCHPGDTLLAEVPAWLLQVLSGPAIMRGLQTTLGTVPDGGRNNYLTSIAGSLRHRGASHEAVLAALNEENKIKCTPPLDSREVERIAASISKYEPSAAPISPPTIPKDVFIGLPGEIIEKIDPHTESSPMAILGQLLVAFGNVVGRNSYFQVEATRHYPNIFALVVGNTSKGRKGTSWQHVLSLFKTIDPNWTENRIMGGLSSGEGLIYQVRDAESVATGDEKKKADPGVDDKRLLTVESEFAGVLKVARREGNTLSSIIRDAWDTGKLRTLTKNSPVRATDAHISVIGHVTKDELCRYLGDEEAFNGFGNRFIFLFVQRSKTLPEGGHIEAVDFSEIHRRLKGAIEAAKTQGRISFDEQARSIWIETYPELSEGKPGLLGAFTARAEAQVIRLATLYALMDSARSIEERHLKAALALWKYCEATCEYIFSSLLGNRVGEEIRKALASSGTRGLSRTEIRDLFHRNKSEKEIGGALAHLLSRGIACTRALSTDGRPAEYWWLSSYYDQTTEGGPMN